MKKNEINSIIESHKIWLSDKTRGACARLLGANLRGADLRGVDLRGAILVGADLSGANLTGANLAGTILEKSNLQGAVLCRANLTKASLFLADLHRANLSGANLTGAGLVCADLSGAKMQNTTLRDVYLSNAIGNRRQIKNFEIADRYVVYTSDRISIGWQNYAIDDIKNIKTNIDSEMVEWLSKWGAVIIKIIDSAPAEQAYQAESAA